MNCMYYNLKEQSKLSVKLMINRQSSKDKGSKFKTLSAPSVTVYNHSYSLNPEKWLHLYSAERTMRVRVVNQANSNKYPYDPK